MSDSSAKPEGMAVVKTAEGVGNTSGGQVFNIILAVVVTTVVTALLTLAGTFLFQGAAIRALGGLAASQVRQSELFEIGTNCGDERVAAMTNNKASFCFLTDISVRQGNLIGNDKEHDGWNECKIEKGTGDKAGQFVLVAHMKGTCGDNQAALPEITCKARCVRF
jgi:hypothetical protein